MTSSSNDTGERRAARPRSARRASQFAVCAAPGARQGLVEANYIAAPTEPKYLPFLGRFSCLHPLRGPRHPLLPNHRVTRIVQRHIHPIRIRRELEKPLQIRQSLDLRRHDRVFSTARFTLGLARSPVTGSPSPRSRLTDHFTLLDEPRRELRRAAFLARRTTQDQGVPAILDNAGMRSGPRKVDFPCAVWRRARGR